MCIQFFATALIPLFKIEKMKRLKERFDYLTFNYNTSMRKVIYTIIIFLIFNTGYGQLRDNRQFEVKTNLFNIAAAGPSIALEFSLPHNWSSMFSVASGRIDYGDFGGVTRYKTLTLEGRKYAADNIFFIGPYIKNIKKQINQKSSCGVHRLSEPIFFY